MWRRKSRIKSWIKQLQQSSDPLRREAAAKELAAFDDDESFNALVSALGDSHLYVCRAAAEALAARRDLRAVPPLVSALQTAMAQDKMYEPGDIAKALAQLGDTGAIERIIEALASPHEWHQRDLQEALTAFGPAAIAPLTAALSHTNRSVRSGAASALKPLALEAAEALIEVLQSGPAPARLGAATALSGADHPDAAKALVAALDDADPSVVQAAALSLGQLRDLRALNPLAALLSRSEPPIRIAAATALGELGDPGAVAPLAAVLPDSAAERSLVKLGVPAIDALLQLLGDLRAEVTESAATVLAQIGPAALEPLLESLRGGEWHRRRAAALGVGRTCDPYNFWKTPLQPKELRRAVSALEGTLDDEHAEVRAAAAEVLGVLGGVAHAGAEDGQGWLLVVQTDGQADMPIIQEAAEASILRLVQALDDPMFRVRAAAATALTIGSPAARAPLLDMLRRPGEVARMAAAGALMLVYDGTDASGIVEALSDRDARVRHATTLAISRHVAAPDRRVPGWFKSKKDYAGVYVADAVSQVVDILARLSKDDEAPHVRHEALRALEAIRKALKRKREHGDIDIYYAPHDVRPSQLHLETEEETVARTAVSADETLVAATRYIDVALFDDESGSSLRLPAGHVLRTGESYGLQVAVRVEPSGIPAVGAREPIREPTHPSPEPIIVTAEGDGFEIDEPVQTLTLVPIGDSPNIASFRVRPTRQATGREDLPAIQLRVYCHFVLLSVCTVRAEVVGRFDRSSESRLGLEQPITVSYDELEELQVGLAADTSRSMNISVSRRGEAFELRFLVRSEAGQNVLLPASLRLDMSELEDALANVRTAWQDIAMGRAYVDNLEVHEDEFRDSIRLLATLGRQLWTLLFLRDKKSALYQVGRWLEEHPLPPDSIIQISAEGADADIVFPWAMLYDRPLPKERYVLPRPDGFWGLRYLIEQRPFSMPGAPGTLWSVDDRTLQFDLMLWGQFRNAKEHHELLRGLSNKSGGKIRLSDPAIVDAETCCKRLSEGDSNIFYFYTHGHTRVRRTTVGIADGLEGFVRLFEALDPSDTRRELFRMLYESVKTGASEMRRSWIELSYGKVYLDELYELIVDDFSSHPLVLLNMCESAQVIPTLSDSFIHFFLNRGAACVVGTECPMTVAFAHPFAVTCLSQILSGASVGRALLDARRHFIARHNPLGLAYTAFGSVSARFTPPPVTDGGLPLGAGREGHNVTDMAGYSHLS